VPAEHAHLLMTKRILTPLDLSDHTSAATFRACEIATKVRASVTGLTVVDTEGIMDAIALPFHAEMLDYPHPKAINMLKDARKKLDTAQDKFQETCLEKNIPSDVRRLKGNPADGILDLARFFDLLVMGLQSHFHFETEEEPGDTLAQVLDLAPIPILLTPAFETDPFRRALIAFDGSPSSTRALHAFVNIWPVYQPEVRIVTSVQNKDLGGHLLDEAQRFLQSHGVEDITTELTEDSIQDAMDDRHLEWADLIVAGVRSKPPMKRFFLGSFARYLVEKSHRILFFCQ